MNTQFLVYLLTVIVFVLLITVVLLVIKSSRDKRARKCDVVTFRACEKSNVSQIKELAENVKRLESEIEGLLPLAAMAGTDSLTGLPNRRRFDERINELQSKFHSSGAIRKDSVREASLLMLDVDNFKLFNDTYGHSVGDVVLKKVAEAIKSCFRPGDVCRWGGEEFAALLPDVTYEFAHRLAERARVAVESTPIRLEDGETIRVTVSIGVSNTSTCGDIKYLPINADRALYKAKEQGRNQVAIA